MPVGHGCGREFLKSQGQGTLGNFVYLTSALNLGSLNNPLIKVWCLIGLTPDRGCADLLMRTFHSLWQLQLDLK